MPVITLTNQLVLSDVPDVLSARLLRDLRMDNPRWRDNERQGRWNRDTPRYLDFRKNLSGGRVALPRGYLRALIDFCKEAGIPWTLDDRRPRLPEVDFTFTGELRDFQRQAVDLMKAKEFGTLSAPTGSGKTVMGLYLIAARRQPALVVAHTRELAYQWRDRITEFLGIPQDEIGLLGDGRHEIGDRVTVALIQTLVRRVADVTPKIGHIVVDECHRAPSRTFTEAVSAFDCRYMLGLTATPCRRDGLDNLIVWHLGNIHHRVSQSRLVSQGDILAPELVVRETEFKPFHDPSREYLQMLDELVADDARNRLIAADVAGELERPDSVCLVLSERRRHCEILHSLLKYRHHVEAGLLTGDLPMPKRRELLERIRNGELRVLVATGQLIGEGFDCGRLSDLFIATPVKFHGRLTQYLGRILRPSPGKDRARVHDYVDVHVGPLKASFASRCRVYGIPPPPA